MLVFHLVSFHCFRSPPRTPPPFFFSFHCRWKMSAKTHVWILERTMTVGSHWQCIHVMDLEGTRSVRKCGINIFLKKKNRKKYWLTDFFLFFFCSILSTPHVTRSGTTFRRSCVCTGQWGQWSWRSASTKARTRLLERSKNGKSRMWVLFSLCFFVFWI